MPDQELKVFEITLASFDGSTDKTDVYVVWIASTSQSFVQRYVGMRSLKLHEPIKEIEIHPDEPGVDFTVDSTGNPVDFPNSGSSFD